MKNQEEIETIQINGTEYVKKDSIQYMPEIEGSYVIARCVNAGVHAGYLKFRADGVIRLLNSRRLYRWWSKFTLSGLAMEGVLESKKSEVRFACVLPTIDLTESDVCEIIYCTEKAKKSIQSIPDHENE